MHRVVVEPSALADIAHHYRYLSDHAHTADYLDAWFDAIVAAILGLGDYPLRFGLAPENVEFEEEIRYRVEGSYRVIPIAQEDRVHVLHVRHASGGAPQTVMRERSAVYVESGVSGETGASS